jgi:galactose mutarotase-like enzyme
MKRTLWAILALLMTGCSTTSFDVALIEPEQFEMTVDGKPTSLYTLSEGLLTMQVTNFGARVVSLWAPDRSGDPADIVIGERINAKHEQLTMGAGYDHNWIIDREDDGTVVKFADLYEPKSGRGIEVWSDQIAMQFYSGNFFDGSYCGKYRRPIEYRGAVVFETQRYPDAPNHPHFPSVVLRAGETYRHTCIYKFYVK